MNYNFFKILLLTTLFSSQSHAGEWDFLSLHGYGSLGVVYQDNEDVLYRNSLYTNKGSHGAVSFSNYTNLGLQLDLHATEDLTFMVQGTLSENNSEGKLFELGWANVKYQITDDFDIKVGKMKLPAFMDTDIMTVAYSYDMVKLPTMYRLIPLSSYTGAELSQQFNFDELSIITGILYGESKSKLYNNYLEKADVNLKEMKAIMVKLMYEGLTLRAGYNKNELTIKNSKSDNGLAQLAALRVPVIKEALTKYAIKDVTYLSLGASYEFEDAYVKGEYIELESNSFLADYSSWYLNLGYNFEHWSPYILYSKTDSKTAYNPIEIAPTMSQGEMAMVTALNQGFKYAYMTSHVDSEVQSIGFRYNLSENSVLKFQYEYLKERDFINYNTDEVIDANIHVFSSAINFVF